MLVKVQLATQSGLLQSIPIAFPRSLYTRSEGMNLDVVCCVFEEQQGHHGSRQTAYGATLQTRVPLCYPLIYVCEPY